MMHTHSCALAVPLCTPLCVPNPPLKVLVVTVVCIMISLPVLWYRNGLNMLQAIKEAMTGNLLLEMLLFISLFVNVKLIIQAVSLY